MNKRDALVFAVVLLSSTLATASDIADKCKASKNKAAGKLAACLQTAEAKLATTGDTAAFTTAVSKCETKFGAKFEGAELKAVDQGGACPTVGDDAAVRTATAAYSTCVAESLGGDPVCLTCGNGLLDAGEDCDLGEDGTGNCDTATAGTRPVGEVSCAAGCGYDTTACYSCEGGAVVGGFCWYLGGLGQSCSAACTAVGKTYSEATRTFAGSTGSISNCDAVLTALGMSTGPVTPNNAGGMGCWTSSSNRYLDYSSTNAYATLLNSQRACACQ